MLPIDNTQESASRIVVLKMRMETIVTTGWLRQVSYVTPARFVCETDREQN